MMQIQDLQKRMNHVGQTIHHAAEVCNATSDVPTDLKQCIQEMDQQSEQATQMMQQTQDEDTVIDCVERLEELSDQARDACEQAGDIDGELRTAVMQAHQELSDLKKQLH